MWKFIDMLKRPDDDWYLPYSLEKMTKHAADLSCGELIDISIEWFCKGDLLDHSVQW